MLNYNAISIEMFRVQITLQVQKELDIGVYGLNGCVLRLQCGSVDCSWCHLVSQASLRWVKLCPYSDAYLTARENDNGQ